MAKIILSIGNYDLKRLLDSKNSVIIRDRFKGTIGDTVYVYRGFPIHKILARFTIEKIIRENPDKLWEITKKHNGFREYDFRQYCNGMGLYFGIYFKNLEVFEPSIDPYEVFENFIAPNNYYKIIGRCSIFELIRSGKVKIKKQNSLDKYFESE